MKVKALASLSTAQGWKAVGEEFTVNAAEADALVERGLVERSGAEPDQVADPATPKAVKASKSKS
ncbi:hypothetical protein [Pseudomonas abietaniphila]|uniref:hypothetical protein n=1 Tax=Pseudomonas abietaniphila TaxID=89065 RepID=UPI000784C4CE|nr:hypothetical protein [Pseudomonas abietaniphila]